MSTLDSWDSLPTGKPLKSRIISCMRRGGYPTPKSLIEEIRTHGYYDMGDHAVPNRGYIRQLGRKGWNEIWSFLETQGFDYRQDASLPQPVLVPQFYLALNKKIDELIEILREIQKSIVPPVP